MPDIKPIETFYKGYRFRSRLEARWAVFFDAAGIQYGYEPQGYKLSDGTCYLPDFFLPEFKAYVEIKPSSISYKDEKEAKDKLERLFNYVEHEDFIEVEGKGTIETPDSAERNNKICLLCKGDPIDNDIDIFCSYTDDSGGGESWFSAMFGYHKYKVPEQVSFSRYQRPTGLLIWTRRDDRYFYGSSWLNTNNTLMPYESEDEVCYDFYAERTKARQARFEHGQCGA